MKVLATAVAVSRSLYSYLSFDLSVIHVQMFYVE